MKNNTSSPKSSSNETSRLGSQIKLGIDAHARKYVVAMKVDCSAPGRPLVFGSAEELVAWAAKLRERCGSLHSCYEAGPLGYGLHRRLAALGVDSHVIRPIVWDEHGRKVKTDGRDATQMALALDGHLRGNTRSFSRIAVPTVEQERERAVARQRQSLARERRRAAAAARGHVLYHEGWTLRGEWWRPRRWEALGEELGEFLLSLLAPLRAIILAIDAQLEEATRRIERREAPELPKGMGPVLFRQIEGEVRDWANFGSRSPATPACAPASTPARPGACSARSASMATRACGPCSSSWRGC